VEYRWPIEVFELAEQPLEFPDLSAKRGRRPKNILKERVRFLRASQV